MPSSTNCAQVTCIYNNEAKSYTILFVSGTVCKAYHSRRCKVHKKHKKHTSSHEPGRVRGDTLHSAHDDARGTPLTYLNVRFVDEPGAVREDLVDFVQVAQLLRDVLEPLEPALVAALQQELRLLDVDEVRALVPSRRLQKHVRSELTSIKQS